MSAAQVLATRLRLPLRCVDCRRRESVPPHARCAACHAKWLTARRELAEWQRDYRARNKAKVAASHDLLTTVEARNG